MLGAGKYAANVDLIRVGGWLGFIAGAEAAYLSCAELCQIAYKREVLPIWSLAR
jgi:succinate-acetate transporter protein